MFFFFSFIYEMLGILVPFLTCVTNELFKIFFKLAFGASFIKNVIFIFTNINLFLYGLCGVLRKALPTQNYKQIRNSLIFSFSSSIFKLYIVHLSDIFMDITSELVMSIFPFSIFLSLIWTPSSSYIKILNRLTYISKLFIVPHQSVGSLSGPVLFYLVG